jgi:hypothetical protein
MLSMLTPNMWGFALIWLQHKHLGIPYPKNSNGSSIHIFFFQMTSYLTKELMSMHVYRLWTTYMHYCINMNWFDTRYVCIYYNIKHIIHLCLSLPPIFVLFGQHSAMWKTVCSSKPAVVFNSTTSLFLNPSDPHNRKYMLYKLILWVQQNP